jgi:hypothetical protein
MEVKKMTERSDYKRELQRARRRLYKAIYRLQMLYDEPGCCDLEQQQTAEISRAEQELCSALQEFINVRGWLSRYNAWIAQHMLWRLSPDYMLVVKPHGLELIRRVVVGIINYDALTMQ